MRGVGSLLVLGWLASAAACGSPADSAPERSAREQTRERRRELSDIRDPILRDFSTNWRQLLSQAPELAYPVVVPPRPPRTPPWEPTIMTQCVFSPDAGGIVPQTTISWNEPIRIDDGGGPNPTLRQTAGAAATTVPLRMDLGLYADAFARNHFSTALSPDVTRRFSLPAASGLVTDEAARNRSGAGLFPRLMTFNTETLVARDTNLTFNRYTIVMRDLNQGVSYSIRVSRLSGEQWSDGRLVEFLTPVCPDSF
jgi:hypothetical protein